MKSYPAIVKFAQQYEVENAGDFLILTRKILSNKDFDSPFYEKMEAENQLRGISYPINEVYEKLSLLDYNLRIPKLNRARIGVKEIQEKLDTLTKILFENKMFISEFDEYYEPHLKVEEIKISVSKKDLISPFVYTVQIVSKHYTIIDKKTMHGGWDEYLLSEGDKTEETKNNAPIKTQYYRQSNLISIIEYTKI